MTVYLSSLTNRWKVEYFKLKLHGGRDFSELFIGLHGLPEQSRYMLKTDKTSSGNKHRVLSRFNALATSSQLKEILQACNITGIKCQCTRKHPDHSNQVVEKSAYYGGQEKQWYHFEFATIKPSSLECRGRCYSHKVEHS